MLRDWIIDYLYLGRGTFTMYRHRRPPKHYLGYIEPGKSPVILLSGITQRWSFLKKMGDKISLMGHPVYVVHELGFSIVGIETAADIVSRVIDENDLKNVIIIGHSKGGLIGKYLLAFENKEKRIKKLIAIATPFSGSSLAKIVPHKNFRELKTNSEIIKKLKAEKHVNNQIVCIFPVFDNHVWSKNLGYLEGAKNIKLNVRGHHKIVFNKELIDEVIKNVESN